jgi:hypothetical protein
MDEKDARALELDIAEDYRRQRQAADARHSGFDTMGRDGFLRWMEANEDVLTKIAENGGATGDAVREAVEEYKRTVSELPVGSPFDDVNAYLILKRIVREVETICREGQVPIRHGVVFGVSPELGLKASQMPVLTTEASIIAVSMPFLPFCNLVSKTLALSMPHTLDGQLCKVSNDPTEVSSNLRSQPALLAQWARIFSSYAIFGWPSDWAQLPIRGIGHNFTRIRLLSAMETFAVAHEYGHHVLKHGLHGSTGEVANRVEDEHEADIFARAISMTAGLQSDPPNFYAASGVGGVIMLGVLELVARTKAVLLTGSDQLQPRKTHPPLQRRIEYIAALDNNSPDDYRKAFIDMRTCFKSILENIWVEISPVFQDLHSQGIRPISDTEDPTGWLPLAL